MTYACPYCVAWVIVFLGIVEVKRLGALCDKVLCLVVYVRDHCPLRVESPCNELDLRGKDRVQGRRAILWGSKVLVQLTSAGLILCIAGREVVFVRHGEEEKRRMYALA